MTAVYFILILIALAIGIGIMVALYLKVGILSNHIDELDSITKEYLGYLKIDALALEDLSSCACENGHQCDKFEQHKCPYLKSFGPLIFRSKDVVPPEKRPTHVKADKLRP